MIGVKEMADTAAIVYLNELNCTKLTSVINGLVSGSIAALVIKNTINHNVCDAIVDAINEREFGHYTAAPDFLKLGSTLYEYGKASNDDINDIYLNESFDIGYNLQKELNNLFLPSSQLRLALDDQWPAGASVLKINGKRAPTGLVRKLDVGSEVLEHQDNSNWDFQGLDGMFNLSWLAYVSDFRGGQLKIYPEQFISQDAHDSYIIEGSDYAIDRKNLSLPKVVIDANKGDVVIFNPFFIHAVSKVESGVRITQSGLISVYDETTPLAFYQ